MILMYTAIEVVTAGDDGGAGTRPPSVISGLCPLIYFRVPFGGGVKIEWA